MHTVAHRRDTVEKIHAHTHTEKQRDTHTYLIICICIYRQGILNLDTYTCARHLISIRDIQFSSTHSNSRNFLTVLPLSLTHSLRLETVIVTSLVVLEITTMLDPISDTPLVLAYVFMSLLVLIVCFIVFNVVHKLYRGMDATDESMLTGGAAVGVSSTKTHMLEVDNALKTG